MDLPSESDEYSDEEEEEDDDVDLSDELLYLELRGDRERCRCRLPIVQCFPHIQ